MDTPTDVVPLAVVPRELIERCLRLARAATPFTLPHSSVDFGRWDGDSFVDVVTPGKGHGRASHRIRLSDVIELRAAGLSLPADLEAALAAAGGRPNGDEHG